MTTPTLQQFAEALDAVRAKYPDAPGLPDGYRFDGRYTRPEPVALWFEDAADNRVVPDAAALALVVVTAMEIGAWWEKQDNDNRAAGLCSDDAFDAWWVDVWQQGKIEIDRIRAASLPSAALAMLEVIGGSDAT